MQMRVTWNDRQRVALLILACFLLASTGWLLWLYHLTSITEAHNVDMLTMGVGYPMQALGIAAFSFLERGRRNAHARQTTEAAIVAYVVSLAPFFDFFTATIDKHIRLFKSADALCHFPMSLGGVQPSRHSTGAKSVVTFGHSKRVDFLKVWRYVQIYPNLHPALLQVSAKVTLAVRLPNSVSHRGLVVYRAIRLNYCTASRLQQFNRVFEQLLKSVVIDIEMISRYSFLVSCFRSPRV